MDSEGKKNVLIIREIYSNKAKHEIFFKISDNLIL